MLLRKVAVLVRRRKIHVTLTVEYSFAPAGTLSETIKVSSALRPYVKM